MAHPSNQIEQERCNLPQTCCDSREVLEMAIKADTPKSSITLPQNYNPSLGTETWLETYGYDDPVILEGEYGGYSLERIHEFIDSSTV